MSKILVTGSHGYLGSILVPMLIAEGHHVTAIDRMIYANDTTLAHLCGNPRFEQHRVDVRDHASVLPFLKDADVVIPLAGLVGVPLGNLNPVDAELVNLRAPLNLFASLSAEQLVVMPTTESSYGANVEVCTEETTLNPLSTYAKHKVEVENALMARGNSISLRLATVFGTSPRMRLDLLVNDFTWRALKDRAFVVFEGQYRRTCVHVTDVARAFIRAIGSERAVFYEKPDMEPMKLAGLPLGIYNVGACTMTKIELCEAIKRQLPDFTWVEVENFSDPDKRDYCVSSEKIMRTGFRYTVDLDAGITELLKGYRTIGVGPHRNA